MNSVSQDNNMSKAWIWLSEADKYIFEHYEKFDKDAKLFDYEVVWITREIMDK